MSVKYLQIQPNSQLPDISNMKPFRSVVVIEQEVTPEWQSLVSVWLAKSGCLYMMAWGKKCSTWDDSVDWANLEEFGYGDIPEDKLILTTWHEKEPLRKVFWFAKNCAFHPVVVLSNNIIVHISDSSKESEILSEYVSM
jgi:hypothetical protein